MVAGYGDYRAGVAARSDRRKLCGSRGRRLQSRSGTERRAVCGELSRCGDAACSLVRGACLAAPHGEYLP